MHNIIFLLNLQQMNNKNKVFLIQEIERIRISKTGDKKKKLKTSLEKIVNY